MNYARWRARVAAYVIDILIVVPFFAAAAVVEQSGDGRGAAYYILGVAGFVVNGYNRWFLAGRSGQSIGRRVVGTRLVGDRSGAPVGVGRAFLRDVAHILDDLILYIGYLFPLWTAKRQTIADMVTRTVVVA